MALEFDALVLRGLLILGMFVGYAWAIYFRLPFFQTHSDRQRMLISAGTALVPLVATLGGLSLVFAQLTHDYRLAKFPSPANPANEIWFYDGGFLDRDLSLYAKSERQKAQFVARLDETGAFRLAGVRWTKDGRAVFCSLILLGEISNKGNRARTESDLPTATVIAYDFSTGKVTEPTWFGFDSTGARYKEANWHEFEPTIEKIIAAHGGLSDKQITDDLVRKNEKTLWFWQTVP